MRAYLLEGPSATRNSTNLSRYPLSLGSTGLGRGGPGADRDSPPAPGGRAAGGRGGGGADDPEGPCSACSGPRGGPVRPAGELIVGREVDKDDEGGGADVDGVVGVARLLS